MKELFADEEELVRQLCFYYREQRFEGKGVLRWSLKDGYRLDAFIDQGQFSLTEITSSKVGKIIPHEDKVVVRMRLHPMHGWAVTPSINLNWGHQVELSSKYLKLEFKKLTYFKRKLPQPENFIKVFDQYQKVDTASRRSVWSGSAIYEISKEIRLPQIVSLTTELDQSFISLTSETGISYQDDNGYKLTGYFPLPNKLQIVWEIPRREYSRKQAWNWAFALKNSISFLYGQDIQLISRSMLRGTSRCNEKIASSAVNSLDSLLRLSSEKGLPDLPQEEVLIRLAQFFGSEVEEVGACFMIFWQLLEASKQEIWQIKEFMVSTALEAMLRSVYQKSLLTDKSKSSKGLVKSLLAKFEQDFIMSSVPDSEKADAQRVWRQERKEVLKYFELLRHRSAHPDWLSNAGGNLSTERLEESIEAMRRLSRFYGYMLLSIAGFQNLRPEET